MASVTVPPAAPSQASGANATPRGGNRGRGSGSGRGGRSGHADRSEPAPTGGAASGESRPPRRRGGSNRRGGGGGDRPQQQQQQQQRPGPPAAVVVDASTPQSQVGPSGPKTETVVKPDADDAASDDDSPVCFICADPVIYSAIAPCNHVTCHICALRMRALYKNKACAHCRTEAEWVIFSKIETKKFLEFTDTDIVDQNEALGIKYDDKIICDDTTLLLHYNCPDADCTQALRNWPSLHHHVKTAHNKVLCDLCSRNKKVFTHEHTLFTPPELRKHERTGDDQPGTETQSGFKGHPECGFCRQRFYSSDELFTHCRDKHERCHICDRRNPAAQQQYYIDYDALAAHFGKDHYVCEDKECLDKKFVVFENEVDLKAHQLEVHPNGLSKTARRDARRIDISSFAPEPSNSGGRRGRGRGAQERDDAPIRTEQQMSRAELAYHRTLAVQSAQSTTSRNFGGQLTAPPPPQPPPQQAPPAPAVRAPPQQQVRPVVSMTAAPQPPARPPARPAEPPQMAFPPLAPPRVVEAPAGPSGGRGPAGAPETDDAKRQRHAAVIDRAKTLLRHNDGKMTSFKASISQYRQGILTAPQLVDTFWSLFDVKAPELGVLVKELADLFEDETKRQSLLKAWNDWRAVNEDYPPFAGASSSAPAAGAASRVLRVKSSTSHSARSTTARQGAWGAAAVVPVALPQPVSQQPAPRSVNRQGPGAHAPTPWVASSAGASTAGGSSSATRKVGKDEFPSLPVKAPPPPGWGPIKKKDVYAAYNGAPTPQQAVWTGGGGGSGERSEEPSESEGPGGEGGGRGKKKGKGKQLLFHVGLQREEQ